MLDVRAFAALCDGCRQLKTVDLVGWRYLLVYELHDGILRMFFCAGGNHDAQRRAARMHVPSWK
jgi:hypothetical protein